MRTLRTFLVTALLCLAAPHLAVAGAADPYLQDASTAAGPVEPSTTLAQYHLGPEHVVQYDAVPNRSYKEAPSQRGQIIPPSTALQIALSASPGSQGLGVSLLKGPRLIYAVKLKTGNQIHRVLVDAETAQVVGE